MTWINNGVAAQDATVTDPIPAGQTFADALACQPFGVSTTSPGLCQYNPGTNAVSWTGNIGPGNANRVEIAFNVTVPGPGAYNNVGVMVFTNPPPALLAQGPAALQAQAAGAVGNAGGGGGGAGAGGGDGGAGAGGPAGNQAPAGPQGPTITVQPLQNLAGPGAPIDWLITVFNPTDQTVSGASIILTVPGNLNLLGAIGNGGAPNINGVRVVMPLDPIPPGGTATLTLNTQAIRDLLAQNITLIAGLQLADGTIIFADGTVFRVPSTLPATGESPMSAWRFPIVLVLIAALLTAAAIGKRVQMHYMPQQK
jgi:hypothetical protein